MNNKNEYALRYLHYLFYEDWYHRVTINYAGGFDNHKVTKIITKLIDKLNNELASTEQPEIEVARIKEEKSNNMFEYHLLFKEIESLEDKKFEKLITKFWNQLDDSNQFTLLFDRQKSNTNK